MGQQKMWKNEPTIVSLLLFHLTEIRHGTIENKTWVLIGAHRALVGDFKDIFEHFFRLLQQWAPFEHKEI